MFFNEYSNNVQFDYSTQVKSAKPTFPFNKVWRFYQRLSRANM